MARALRHAARSRSIQRDALNLNDNDLNLGNDTRTIATTNGGTGSTRVDAPIFGVFGAPTSGYTVSAPIGTATNNSGNLRIRDFDYVFEGAIGDSTKALSSVRIDNARATFKGDIAANTVDADRPATPLTRRAPPPRPIAIWC